MMIYSYLCVFDELMKKLRTAVIGVGYLGKFHAQKYSEIPHSELVGICDINHEVASAIAAQCNVTVYTDYHQLIGKVDAVSIAVPTSLHHEIALFFLNQGVHVLLEKPISRTLAEAEELIQAAEKHRVILQIGHLERFNNVIKAVQPSIQGPVFIESLRTAPFQLRGTDVNVVLDLMIHDIDIIQSLVQSSITHISASGAPVLSSHIDIASARIEFANGCAANVTANRVGRRKKRIIHIFQHDAYIKLDLNRKKLTVHHKGNKEMFPGIPEITHHSSLVDQGDALKDQLTAFLSAILENTPPIVSGQDGKQALETAIRITEIVFNKNSQRAKQQFIQLNHAANSV